MSLQQFKNLSSWREHSISIAPKSVGELDFKDTFPNMFVIQNPNDCIVYIGISKTPTEDSYEFRVGNNSNDCFGRPTGTKKVMFYNSCEREIFLKVFSVYDVFNLLVLKNMSALIESATVVTDGIVKGFSDNTALPSGDNIIGKIIPYGEDWKELLSNVGGLNEKTMDSEQLQKMLTAIESKLKFLYDFSNQYKQVYNSERVIHAGGSINTSGSIFSDTLVDFGTMATANNLTYDTSNYDYYLKINFLDVYVETEKENSQLILGEVFGDSRILLSFHNDETIISNVLFKITPTKSNSIYFKNLFAKVVYDIEIIAKKKFML